MRPSNALLGLRISRRLRPHRGRLKDSLGCGYFGMLREIEGAKSAVNVAMLLDGSTA